MLLSWAVPKGPSLDSTIKRLAMHVEDHPIDYGEFEGVIPSGYGAGIVMLWDRGTWTPETDDVAASLAKGDLKFTLDGYKLKGSWVLVRTKGRFAGAGSEGEPWLLIKHRDDWSGPIDIAEFAPLSVKTEGDFADILSQDDPDVWKSNRPAKGGETGALFERIVKRALELRESSRHRRAPPGRRHRAPRKPKQRSRRPVRQRRERSDNYHQPRQAPAQVECQPERRTMGSCSADDRPCGSTQHCF